MASRKVQIVTWKDHSGGQGWKSSEELEDWAKHIFSINQNTMGYVTYEDDNVLVLSMSFSEDEQAFNHMMLLKSDIIKRKTIKIA